MHVLELIKGFVELVSFNQRGLTLGTCARVTVVILCVYMYVCQ